LINSVLIPASPVSLSSFGTKGHSANVLVTMENLFNIPQRRWSGTFVLHRKQHFTGSSSLLQVFSHRHLFSAKSMLPFPALHLPSMPRQKPPGSLSHSEIEQSTLSTFYSKCSS
jgi:hypothetical protein